MRTENIYDAISGFDEEYVSASDNNDAIRLSFRKNRARKIKMIGTVCTCAVVVMVSGWIGSQGWFGKKPPVEQNPFVPQESTSVSDDQTTGQAQDQQTTVGEQSTTEPAKETESRISKREAQTQTTQTDNPNRENPTTKPSRTDVSSTTKPSQTNAPSTTKDKEKPTASSVEPTSVDATTVVDKPQNVYKDVSVDYNTAKSYFGHSIVPCNRSDFTGYSVLLVSPNGNNNEQGTKCLSLTYLFTKGSVVLYDQGKTGKITPTGNRQEYRGKIFYVHTPEFNGDNIRIGYYPTGESGVAYQANFNSGSDVNEIMDLILSLEM